MIAKSKPNNILKLAEIEQKAPEEYGLVSVNSFDEVDNNSQ